MNEFDNTSLPPELVEHCYKLSLADFGTKLLYPESSHRKYDLHEDYADLPGKEGKAILWKRYGTSYIEVSYQILFADTVYIEIQYNFGPLRSSTQSIMLEEEEAPYGTRVYMLCGCSKRCNTLYLRLDNPYYFACCKCLNLRYELTQINRSSTGGDLCYRFNRHMKALEIAPRVRRIDYAGRFTRRARSMLKLARYMQ